jgi:hypothetical protein
MLRYHHGSGPASDPFDAGEAARARVPLPRGEVHPSVARDGQAEINRPAKAENRLLLSTSHAATRSCERSARISSAALCHELRHGRKPFSPRRSQFAERRVGRQRHWVYPTFLRFPGSWRDSGHLGLGGNKVRPRRLPQGSQSHGYLALRRLVHIVDPQGVGRSASAARFLGRLSHFVSKRSIWPAEAANLWIARSPTTHRIAGSGHSRFASFTSS